jgi:hypothetical protein
MVNQGCGTDLGCAAVDAEVGFSFDLSRLKFEGRVDVKLIVFCVESGCLFCIRARL